MTRDVTIHVCNSMELPTLKKQVGLAIVLASLALAGGLQDWRIEARGEGSDDASGTGWTRRRRTIERSSSRTRQSRPARGCRRHEGEIQSSRATCRHQFPSDAVGTTESVTGTLVLNPDGSIDAGR